MTETSEDASIGLELDVVLDVLSELSGEDEGWPGACAPCSLH